MKEGIEEGRERGRRFPIFWYQIFDISSNENQDRRNGTRKKKEIVFGRCLIWRRGEKGSIKGRKKGIRG